MYTLHIANKNYSSWSLRPWILLRQLDIAFDEALHPFQADIVAQREQFAAFSPSGKVPALQDEDTTVWDRLAIVEYLAEKACRRLAPGPGGACLGPLRLQRNAFRVFASARILCHELRSSRPLKNRAGTAAGRDRAHQRAVQ
nr:glutathione S-transferase N-terminal domain-containing protein [Advenella sp. S44]